jgi:phage/plasmid-associated DNA primase
MQAMDSDEKEICDYLKTYHGQFVSAREIARRAGGKWRYRDDPNWATPALLRLVEQEILESDAAGYYRLRRKEDKKKRKKWIAPQIKAILEGSGKDFGDLLDADEQEDFFK